MQKMRNFWSSHQAFFRNFITALKVPTAIRETEKALKDGKSVVISLIGTGEANEEEQVKRAAEEGIPLEELDFSPREILRSLVMKGFRWRTTPRKRTKRGTSPSSRS